MAKQQRRRVALFEVIHKDKRFADPASLRPQTPSWFFRNKPASAGAAIADEGVDELSRPARSQTRTMMPAKRIDAGKSNPRAASLLGVPPAGAAVAVLEPPQADESSTIESTSPADGAAFEPTSVFGGASRRNDEMPASATDAFDAGIDLPRVPTAMEATAEDYWPAAAPAGHFAPLDSGKRDGTGNSPLTLTSGAIIGATALAVLWLGFKLTHSPQQSAAAPADTQGVTFVNGIDATPKVDTDRGVLDLSHVTKTVTPVSGTLATDAGPRQAGHQYMLIHLYESEKSATAASNFFNASQIACTVEHDLPSVDPHMFAVVGLKPCDRPQSADAINYTQHLKQLFAKGAGSGSSAKAFKPRLIKWN